MFFGCTMNMSLSTVTCFCFYDFFFNVFSINFKDISHLDLLLLLSVLYWFKEKPSEIFLKNGALHKNTIFREKRLYWGLFLTNLWAFRSGTVLKRDSDTGAFLWILGKFSRAPVSYNISWDCFWLLIFLDFQYQNCLTFIVVDCSFKHSSLSNQWNY